MGGAAATPTSGVNRTEPGPAKPQRSGGFAISPSLGLWVRFSDWNEEGQIS